MKLCECGCGQPAPLAKYNSKRFGWVKGIPTRFIHNHHLRGARNVNYNGGLCFSQGRYWIRCRDNTYVQYARAVMEAAIGCPLTKNEVVHHKDYDATNDAIENLQLLTKREHAILHATRYTDAELLEALRAKAALLGRTPTASDIDNDPAMPTRETYRLRLGGLRKARILAGVA